MLYNDEKYHYSNNRIKKLKAFCMEEYNKNHLALNDIIIEAISSYAYREFKFKIDVDLKNKKRYQKVLYINVLGKYHPTGKTHIKQICRFIFDQYYSETISNKVIDKLSEFVEM